MIHPFNETAPTMHPVFSELAKVRAELAAERALADMLAESLREISKGEGAFSRDPFEHAANTIENAVNIATTALAAHAEARKERT